MRTNGNGYATRNRRGVKRGGRSGSSGSVDLLHRNDVVRDTICDPVKQVVDQAVEPSSLRHDAHICALLYLTVVHSCALETLFVRTCRAGFKNLKRHSVPGDCITDKKRTSKAAKVKPSNLIAAALLAPYAFNFVRALMKDDPEISELHIIVKRRRNGC